MKSGTLDMQTISDALFVYADIWNKNTLRFASGLLTFDTGATVTTISKDILFNLGYNVVDGDVRRIATASGIEYVREVNIDKMRLGKFVLPQVSVYAHTFPAEGFSTGVIGLNILSKFDISMLFSKNLIELVEI